MVEPLYVLVTPGAGDRRLRLDMFPGRLDMFPGVLVLGVRPRRGLSVGGRGAGPGFMNGSLEYMLLRFGLRLAYYPQTVYDFQQGKE